MDIKREFPLNVSKSFNILAKCPGSTLKEQGASPDLTRTLRRSFTTSIQNLHTEFLHFCDIETVFTKHTPQLRVCWSDVRRKLPAYCLQKRTESAKKNEKKKKKKSAKREQVKSRPADGCESSAQCARRIYIHTIGPPLSLKRITPCVQTHKGPGCNGAPT